MEKTISSAASMSPAKETPLFLPGVVTDEKVGHSGNHKNFPLRNKARFGPNKTPC